MPTELSGTVDTNLTYPYGIQNTGGVVVRIEEILIVLFVLILWVGAIALFFNRWGKIRMLEPYQPKFQQQHRPSCAIVDPTPLQHRTCSKFNIHCLEYPASCSTASGNNANPRRNSVFVNSSASLLPNNGDNPRRAKSAFNLHSLLETESNGDNDDGNEDKIEQPSSISLSSLKPNQRVDQRRKSVCQFDRMDVLARGPTPTSYHSRDRGMSICQFDKMDVLAYSGRPARDRGMSVCQSDRFDRTESMTRGLQSRDRGMSICQFDKTDVLAYSGRPTYQSRYKLVCQSDLLGACSKTSLHSRGNLDYHFDRMDVLARPKTPSQFSKTMSRERRQSMLETYAVVNPRNNFCKIKQPSVLNETCLKLDEMDTNREEQSSSTCSNPNEEDDDDDKTINEQENQNSVVWPHDRPSSSQTLDATLGYKATRV